MKSRTIYHSRELIIILLASRLTSLGWRIENNRTRRCRLLYTSVIAGVESATAALIEAIDRNLDVHLVVFILRFTGNQILIDRFEIFEDLAPMKLLSWITANVNAREEKTPFDCAQLFMNRDFRRLFPDVRGWSLRSRANNALPHRFAVTTS